MRHCHRRHRYEYGRGRALIANESKQIEIFIREDLDLAQRAWLVAKLEHETGIVSAWFADEDHHRLTLHYEPEHFSHETLLDSIRLHGCHGEVVPT